MGFLDHIVTPVNPKGGSGTMDDRHTACTPRWLADVLGLFDLDPCSNPRAHIQATCRMMLETGDDGLVMSTHVRSTQCRVFCNPPYVRGQVIRWVRAYLHTDFTFLLRWDTSTEWFAAIMKETRYVWFSDQRIEFEPPPGLTFSSNPYPHALYMKREPLPWFRQNGYLLCRGM